MQTKNVSVLDILFYQEVREMWRERHVVDLYFAESRRFDWMFC
jgi:hypothetical protein